MDDQNLSSEQPYAERPNTLRNLRACRMCKLIKSYIQFLESFCDNCWSEWADGKKPDTIAAGIRRDKVNEYTTSDFEGQIAMMQPSHSWVSRWLHMHKYESDGTRTMLKPGVYAVSLPGEEMDQGENAEDDHYEEDADHDAYADEDYDAGAGVEGQKAGFDTQASQNHLNDDTFASDFD